MGRRSKHEDKPLTKIRRGLKLTQKQFAAALGVSRDSLAKSETQDQIPVELKRRIVERLGISAEGQAEKDILDSFIEYLKGSKKGHEQDEAGTEHEEGPIQSGGVPWGGNSARLPLDIWVRFPRAGEASIDDSMELTGILAQLFGQEVRPDIEVRLTFRPDRSTTREQIVHGITSMLMNSGRKVELLNGRTDLGAGEENHQNLSIKFNVTAEGREPVRVETGKIPYIR